VEDENEFGSVYVVGDDKEAAATLLPLSLQVSTLAPWFLQTPLLTLLFVHPTSLQVSGLCLSNTYHYTFSIVDIDLAYHDGTYHVDMPRR